MNRNFIVNIFMMGIGAGIGSLATYKFLKTKYEKLVNEEIESVKETFSNLHTKDENIKKDLEEPQKSRLQTVKGDTARNEEGVVYDDILGASGYNDSSDIRFNERGAKMNEPYIISPDEFGDHDYATISLWYYTDGTVTNDAGQVISNAEDLIGTEFSDHFGDYEGDSDTVYVRNDDHEIDYQVLMEYRAYSTL